MNEPTRARLLIWSHSLREASTKFELAAKLKNAEYFGGLCDVTGGKAQAELIIKSLMNDAVIAFRQIKVESYKSPDVVKSDRAFQKMHWSEIVLQTFPEKNIRTNVVNLLEKIERHANTLLAHSDGHAMGYTLERTDVSSTRKFNRRNINLDDSTCRLLSGIFNNLANKTLHYAELD